MYYFQKYNKNKIMFNINNCLTKNAISQKQ